MARTQLNDLSHDQALPGEALDRVRGGLHILPYIEQDNLHRGLSKVGPGHLILPVAVKTGITDGTSNTLMG